DAIDLDERGRVIDEGDTQPPLANPLRRPRSVRRLRMPRPCPPLPIRHPLEKRPLGLPAIFAIPKPLAVEMIADRAAPPRSSEENPRDRRRAERRANRDCCLRRSPHRRVFEHKCERLIGESSRHPRCHPEAPEDTKCRRTLEGPPDSCRSGGRKPPH